VQLTSGVILPRPALPLQMPQVELLGVGEEVCATSVLWSLIYDSHKARAKALVFGGLL